MKQVQPTKSYAWKGNASKYLRAVELQQQGWKREEIAAELGVSSRVVTWWIENVKAGRAVASSHLQEHLEKEPQKSIGELVDFIVAKVGRPSEAMAVAALLETYGIRDIDAQDAYGVEDVFALAENVYTACLDRPAISAHTAQQG